MAKALKITQVKSESHCNKTQRATLKAMGLRGIGSVVFRSDLMAVRGMLNKTQHLVVAEQVDGPVSKESLKTKPKKTYEIKKK